MRKKRPKRPQDDESPKLLSWRVKPEIGVLLEQAALMRGWPVTRILEEGGVMRALEICTDALRGLAKVRAANRKARARKAGQARHAK